MKLTNVGCVILAAGSSSRMGKPKQWLAFNEEYSFLERLIQVYQELGIGQITVVVNPKIAEEYPQKIKNSFSQVRLIVNKHLEYERFFSLKKGLQSYSEPLPCFVQPVDNPFVSPHEICFPIYQASSPNGYAVPVFQGRGGHPIFLSSEVVSALTSSPKDDENLRHFLQAFPRTNVAMENDLVLRNVDTPELYQKYFPQFSLNL